MNSLSTLKLEQAEIFFFQKYFVSKKYDGIQAKKLSNRPGFKVI